MGIVPLVHGSSTSNSPKTPKSESPVRGSSKSDNHELAPVFSLTSNAQSVSKGTVDPRNGGGMTKKIDKYLPTQRSLRDDGPQVWVIFANGECSILASGLTTNLLYHLVEISVTNFVLLIADLTEQVGPQSYGHCSDAGLLEFIHRQHQHRLQMSTDNDVRQTISPILFMLETAEYLFYWEADNQTRLHYSGLSQGSVTYGNPLSKDHTVKCDDGHSPSNHYEHIFESTIGHWRILQRTRYFQFKGFRTSTCRFNNLSWCQSMDLQAGRP